MTPTAGTASITGIVVDDQQPAVAVRRAVVTVAGPELVPSRSAITDDEGRFSVGALPAGRFTITVSRGAFVTSSYGAKRPGRPGTTVVVAAGARVNNVTITLWRGAVVAGVVRDEDGQPASGVPVRVTRAHASTDRSILTLDNRGVQTNEAGEFRIFGLEPGEYLVSAVPPSLRGMAPTGMSEAEMDAALADLRSRRPGTTPPRASTPISPPAVQPFTYAPIFFPGTPSMSHATPITLASGQVAEGLDFALQRVSTAIVGGIALRPGGEPAAGASVQLVQVPPAGGFALDSPIQLTASTALDGTFRFSGVAPGDYRLRVGAAIAGTAPGRGGYQGPPGGGPALWGEMMLDVAGSARDQVLVQLAPAPTLTGRVEFSGTAAPPGNPAQWRVSLVDAASLARRPGDQAALALNNAPPPVQVKADGTFDIQGIAPGVYQFQVVGPGLGPTGWWPRSLAAGDRDLLDRVLDVRVGMPSLNVVLTMSDRHTELSGRVQTAIGQPASDIFVIAFSTDRQHWGTGARRVRTARPGIDGQFSFQDLPPGEYFLGALSDIDADEWQNPTLLEQLTAASARVTIGEGEKKVQDLGIRRPGH